MSDETGSQPPPGQSPSQPAKRARVIVVGNEKGGSGKSTTAMHLITALLKMGFDVGSMDLDARQGTLTRYIQNRMRFSEKKGLELPVPRHYPVHRSDLPDSSAARREESHHFNTALAEMINRFDYIVLDCPGSDNYLSRLGHGAADTLITPMNDSFIDLDMLARIDVDTLAIDGPSVYAELVWDAKKRRAHEQGGTIDWIVMRNRLSHLDARNKREIETLLRRLSQRIKFRIAPGFGERVIYREMFLKGLTLLDLRDHGVGVQMNMSHMAARQEVRSLLEVIGFRAPDGQELLI